MPIATLITGDSIVLQFIGKSPRIIPKSSKYSDRVLDMLRYGATDEELIEYIDPLLRLKQHDCGRFEINDNGYVVIDGEVLPESLSKRLIEFADNNIMDQVNVLIKFWDNCKLNPDPIAKTDLYNFMNHNNIPLTPDGCFVAYKKVTKDKYGNLVDCRTKSMLNNVGRVVKMERNQVNNNRYETCSAGLHVAAFNYAKSFMTGVLVEVKVNPKDVVSIPIDYNGEKMRVCEYEVLSINSEVPEDSVPLDTLIYNNGYEYDDELNFKDDDELLDFDSDELTDTIYVHDNGTIQTRDSKGRFLPKK